MTQAGETVQLQNENDEVSVHRYTHVEQKIYETEKIKKYIYETEKIKWVWGVGVWGVGVWGVLV